jgi:hypothetical protein
MASWILVPSLVSLRNEINALAPNREKYTDGSVGDSSHSGSSSDHNPDETGRTPYEDSDNINEVHAIDVDVDLKKVGWSMTRITNLIVSRHRAGLDNRLQNVIYNRKIASRSWGWTWEDYDGDSPHTGHAHFSARYTTAQENDTRPWGLLAQEKEDSEMTVAEFLAALETSRAQDALERGAGVGVHNQELFRTGIGMGTAINDTRKRVEAMENTLAEILAKLNTL